MNFLKSYFVFWLFLELDIYKIGEIKIFFLEIWGIRAIIFIRIFFVSWNHIFQI